MKTFLSFLILWLSFTLVAQEVKYRDTSPMWSFDGLEIVYTSDKDGNADVVLTERESGKFIVKT